MDKRSTYKEPEIFTGKLNPNTTWRIVWYEMISPGVWKRARPTGNLNRITSVEDRLIAAKILCKMISEALEKGWRYFKQKELKQYDTVNLIECLVSHTESKAAGLSTVKSGQSYKSWVKIFTDFLREKHLAHLRIEQLTPLHIQLFIDHQLAKKKSNRTINNIVSGVAGVFARIKKLHKLPVNPFREVDKLTTTESTRFENFTDKELITISAHLKEVCPELRLFFFHIYYAYMRPASIMQMRAADYDFEAGTINIAPAAHKNRKGNIKQMLWPLREALQAAGVDRLDKDSYIFSSGLKPGKSLRTTSGAGKLWLKHVVHGLGIKKKLYAAKHTGATNFLIDNSGKEHITWFQNQMGHSSLAESEAYITGIGKSVGVKVDEAAVKVRKF